MFLFKLAEAVTIGYVIGSIIHADEIAKLKAEEEAKKPKEIYINATKEAAYQANQIREKNKLKAEHKKYFLRDLFGIEHPHKPSVEIFN